MDPRRAPTPIEGPDITVPVSTVFDLDVDMQVPAYSSPSEHSPDIDPSYRFDRAATLSILSGFMHDRRVLIHGYHGTGKSTHIEQVAARLNWPCQRVNLDSQISRADLVGRPAGPDGATGQGVTEGVLSWSIQRPVALIFDEYDAGLPEVMFVIQRLLEADGTLLLPEQNRTLMPHAGFRLFATANTVGLGDPTGLYAGTRRLNQAQMDRWNVVTRLDYLPPETEREIVLRKLPQLRTPEGEEMVDRMLACAAAVRRDFMAGDLQTVISPRTVLAWAENLTIFGDAGFAFETSFLNKCAREDVARVREIYAQTVATLLGEAACAEATLL